MSPRAALRPTSHVKAETPVLPGGGALGSYQAGLYEALSRSDHRRRDDRRQHTKSPRGPAAPLWWHVTPAPALWSAWAGSLLTILPEQRRQIGSAAAILFSQAGFFQPRPLEDCVFGPQRITFYAFALRGTLKSLVDFDRINHDGEPRLSVGSIRLRSGDFA